MSSKPTVTVAIIAYKQEDFIVDAVRSVASQDYAELEVLVADDGSPDATAELVRREVAAAPERIRLVTGPNVGITGNCNRGLREARGEFVVFLGGDDLLLPGKVAAQSAWLRASSERVLCGHDVEHFLSSSNARLCLQSQITPLRSGVGPREMIMHGNPFASPAIMVRRSAIPSYGFDERLPRVSDGKLWVDCVAGGGTWGYVDGVLARYRRHSASISESSSDKCFEEALQTMDLLEQDRPELASVCALGRARLRHRNGLDLLLRGGDPVAARRELWVALGLAPLRDVKLPAWLALSYLPNNARKRLLSLRRGN